MIGICSYFRDSQIWENIEINQVNKFFNNTLSNLEGLDNWYYFLLEGGSKDNTWESLEYHKNELTNINLIKDEENQSTKVSSVVSKDRFKNLSRIGNKVLNSAKNAGCDLIFWMESDLIPINNLIKNLLEWTKEEQWTKTLAISPVPYFNQNGQKLFYDTWAFEGSKDEKWNNSDLSSLINYKECLRPMRSIGSCALMNGNLLRKYNIDFGEGCFPELCRQAKSFGLNIYCDVSQEIKHPALRYIGGRLI